MYVFTCLYHHPEDPQAFDDHFFTVHAPLARKVVELGLRSATATKLDPNPDGSPPPFYVKVDIAADSAEALQAAMNTPEGQAAQADMANFAGAGFVMFTGEVVDEILPEFPRGT